MLYLLLFYFFPLPHGDIHQRIQELTTVITQHRDSVELYMARGELYLLHEDFNEAQSDFTFCIEHGLINQWVYLGLSKSIWPSGSVDSSLLFADLALNVDPTNPSCMEWRGFLLSQMERFCESSQSYTELLSLSHSPSPSLFIDASNAQARCTDPGSEEKAINILRDGIRRIGPLRILENELVDLYVQWERWNDALLIQNQIIDHSPVKTKPLYRRAQIYRLMEDNEMYRKDLDLALNSLDELPGYKSSIPSMQELRMKITDEINNVGH